MDHRRKPLVARGFTLIELLIVIGVIGVLVAIAFVGFRALERSGSNNRTRTMLANAASMLTEYETATAFKKQPPYMWDLGNAQVATPGNFWRDADPAAAGEQPMPGPEGSVEEPEGAADPNKARREASQAVRNTAVVMQEIGRIPGAKQLLAQLPAGSTTTIPLPVSATTTVQREVLLDGWGNPIIFVPAAGLGPVYLGEKGNAVAYVVTNTKTYKQPGTFDPLLIMPNARPFFASAGPDGAFDFLDVNNNGAFDAATDVPAGDDNIYSF